MTSELLEAHQPCPCGQSSDAYATYTDGHGHCFSCGKNYAADGKAMEPAPTKKGDKPLLRFGRYQSLTARKINEKTCETYGYFITDDDNGNAVQVAPYRNRSGQVVGQKVRGAGKKFFTTGDMSEVALFGQHLFRNGGKRVLVVEGEVDALSAYQMLGTWPVVSIPNGAQGAAKAIRANIEWLESYDTVIFGFDMDDPGRAAALECASILTPGKAAILELPRKDANEMLQEGLIKEFVSAFWEAREYRPDGIVNGTELWDALNEEIEQGVAYPWADLNIPTYGMRKGELVVWTSGSGMGKSTAVAEIAYDLLVNHGLKIGYVALEENVKRTAQRMVGLHLNKPIHLPGQEVSLEEKRAAFDATLGTGRFYTFDHFGSIESDSILNKIMYLAKGCGVDFIFLDHLSIIVSGMDQNEDERRTIDVLMTKLRSLVEETGVGLHLVSHLRRPSGDKGHEQGAEVSLAHLRGSHSIVQLADLVIALERNQQSENEEERNVIRLRILKNRYSGITGPAGFLEYQRETGRLLSHVPELQGASDESDY